MSADAIVRTDGERLDFLDLEARADPITLHDLPLRGLRGQYRGLGLSRRTLREAVDHAQFERELQEQRAPSAEIAAYPLRLLL
jgi:hypothetical protein